MAGNKIITLTANTAIDCFIEVNNFSPGDNIVADESIEFASGKGVNVAKAIESLAGQVLALGFVGRKSVDLFNDIKSPLLAADYTAVEGNTRTNITLSDVKSATETHIRTRGFSVTAVDCKSLIRKITGYINEKDVVVLSGSLPLGADKRFYATLIEKCHRKSAIPILDGSGEELLQGVKAKPFMIKPNQREFECLLGYPLADEYAIVSGARRIIATGVKWVIVSRGEQGAVAVDDSSALAVSLDCRPFGVPVSYVGCGDAMVAGLALAVRRGYSLREAMQLGVACGTANLFSVEPGKIDRKRVALMNSHVTIRDLCVSYFSSTC